MTSGTDACASLCRLMPALNFEIYFLGGSNIVIYSYVEVLTKWPTQNR